MPRTGRPSMYGNELYNKEIKERFLEENYSNLGTRARYKKLFLRTFEYENQLNKDVYNFTLDEIKDMVVSLSSSSPATVSSTVSILNKYIQWAIHEGFVNSVINVVEQYIDIEEVRKMVSVLAQENRYLRNEQELINIINLCKNPQDSVCFVLAYHGLKADEILDIEKDNIKENTITVNEKTIELNNYYMDVVKRAIGQTIYIKNNGIGIDDLRSPELKLDLNSKYLLRGVQNSKKEEGSKLTKQMINSRIKKVIDSFGDEEKLKKTFKTDEVKIKTAKQLNRPLITLTTIYYSGIFIKLQKLEQEKGKLEQQDFIDMREEYGLTTGNWNDLKSRYDLWKKSL